jgi:hypothetical protein
VVKLALAVGVASVAAALLVFACGGSVREAAPADACADAAAQVDVASEEAAASWWVDVFDASAYVGFDPPVVGEYPPNGSSVCLYSGCFVEGTCDPVTGWCCGGREKQAECVCGEEAGCVPPAVCCALPGALVLRCVATPDDCPDAR